MNQTSNKMGGLPWIAAIAFFMQALDATILNTALPDIAHSLHRSPLAMQSAIISYLLTVAMLIPTSGWCADRFGTQRVFVFAVSLFSLGSLFCALSSSLTALVLSRILQGVGGAMMMPVARLTLLRAYPRDELLPVLNFVTMPGLIGPIVGPIVGGWLVTYASWHWIFLINIPIGLLGIIFSYRYMPNFTTTTRHFDGKGFLLFGIGLVCLSLSLELFSEPVLNAHYPLLFLALAIVLLSCYLAHARHYPKALIPLSLFNTRTFSIGIVGNIAARLGTGCIPFLLPLMLQVGFGYSALTAGYMLAPTAIGSLLAKSFVTRILRRFGYRHTLMTLTALISLFLALFALQNVNTPIWLTLLPLFLLGIITSLQFTAMNTITLADLDNENTSGGNSVLAVTQQLAVSFGISVSAAILQFYNHHQMGSNIIDHFHYTFITIGILTLSASAIFMQLNAEDGNNLIAKRAKP